MRRTAFFTAVLVLVAALAAGAYLLSRDEEPIRASVTVAEAMFSDTTGYARAQEVRPFIFPEDHGPHPDFKNEWWYYTGNLETAAGRHFGFELTIFRFALAPPDTAAAGRASNWAARQLYMGHFALSDVEGNRFYPFERFSRGAAGLAGAQAAPLRIWLEDWVVEGSGAERPAMRVRAAEDGVGVDLLMEPLKPVVLQGDRGLDQKADGLGNASYYYSLTRLRTEGTVTVGGTTYDVRGLSWMDREWSTSALGEDQVGWDWFALQLSDGRDLMYYQLRERGGAASPYSNGVLVGPDGRPRHLEREEVEVEVRATWQSPHSGAVYPASWRLRIPSEDLSLQITPYLADQEMDVSVRYWEGAVRIEGTAGSAHVTGSGYVEMTGYDDESGGAGAQRRGARAEIERSP